MIGSLTILPFPSAPGKMKEPLLPEKPLLPDVLQEPLVEPLVEPLIEPLVEEPQVAYVPLPSLPRTDDLCHQDLQLITIGTFAVSLILCSVLLNALMRA